MPEPDKFRPRQEWGRFAAQPEVYGESVLGQPLEVWLPPNAEPPIRMLVMAGIHGEEPETTCVLSRTLRSLHEPLRDCAVVLAANPDGLRRGTRSNANGVDLNRNFPASNWCRQLPTHRWTVEEESDVPLSPGEAPGSEPEVTAFLQLIDRLRPASVVALHAPLACIDDPASSPLGQWLSERTALPLVEDVGYPTPGSFGSWAAEQQLPVITYEFERLSMEHLSMKHGAVLAELLTGSGAG